MTVEDIVRASQAFQAELAGKYWEEYGVSDEDASRGILAALRELGFADEVSVQSIATEWERQKQEKRKASVERERLRRASLTPEQVEIEDSMRRNQDAMISRIADSLFQSSPLLGMMRGKEE